MRNQVGKTWIGLSIILLFAAVTHAQSKSDGTVDRLQGVVTDLVKRLGSPEENKLREATIDFSVPKSPAFTALGLTPESVVRPTSPRAFAASLLSGADPRGNFQTGVAVETAPYLLLEGNNLTLKDYRDSYLIRLFSRTQFSFATAKGANDEDEATRVALGFFISPFDRGDPRKDPALLNCFQEGFKGVHQEAVNLQNDIAPLVARESLTPQELGQIQQELEKKIAPLEKKAGVEADKCRDLARPRNWNASAWSLGVAPTWTSPKGNVRDLDWSGVSLWTSIGYGFEEIPGLQDNAQMLLHARYRSDELVADPDESGKFFKQDTLTVAGQLRIAGFNFRETIGGPDLNFLAEAAYVRENRRGRKDEELFRYTVGFDYKITDNLYLDVSIGTEDGRKKGGDSGFGMAGLKWGFSDQPLLSGR
jgi:hypothetical protein